MSFENWVHLNWWESKTWLNLQKKIENDNDLIFPARKNWYRALELTPFEKVKCVILGQDPYSTPGMACGLSFSVPPTVHNLPPSLRNIFKEYAADTGYPQPRNGDLSPWAERGVLLLNTVLTVKAGKPLSHAGLGWEKLTIEIVQKLNEYRKGVVFLLWGKHAQEYKNLLTNCATIGAPHPSPYSANTGFFGHRPFTGVNNILKFTDYGPINWRL